MSIFIFKTNLDSIEDVGAITKILNNNEKISKWHIDSEDVDNVLRIEAITQNVDEIITATLMATGFKCEELPE